MLVPTLPVVSGGWLSALVGGWHRIAAAGPAPSGAVLLLLAAAVAGCAVGPPVAWRWVRYAVTLVHEGGHAVVALACGRQLRGVRLHTDTSGVTVTGGRVRGPGMIATVAAGYPGPAVLGLAAAALVAGGHAAGLLWGLLALTAALLAAVRNAVALAAVLAVGAGLFAACWWVPPAGQSFLVAAVAWFLLLAAPRPVLELRAERRSGGGGGSDAEVLAGLTWLPAATWEGLFGAVNVAALLLGGFCLLR